MLRSKNIALITKTTYSNVFSLNEYFGFIQITVEIVISDPFDNKSAFIQVTALPEKSISGTKVGQDA